MDGFLLATTMNFSSVVKIEIRTAHRLKAAMVIPNKGGRSSGYASRFSLSIRYQLTEVI